MGPPCFPPHIFKNTAQSCLLPSGQRAVQMHVPAVDEPMLAGDVSSLIRKQKDRGVGDLRWLSHSAIEWNLGNDLLQFLFGIGKRTQPLPVKRRHHLGGNDGVDTYTVRKQ